MPSHQELADLCRRAYPPAAIEGEPIGQGGARCHVIHGEPTVVIFRGTADVGGLLTDLDANLVPHLGGGLVHQGFYRAWNILAERVKRSIRGARTVILTGHSLGGAIAQVAALEIDEVAEVVTFGSPRVGDAAFAARPTKPHSRYVHGLDPVPWLPGLLAGYRHGCPPRWWSGSQWRDGLSLLGLVRMAWELLETSNVSFVGRLLGHHSIDRYCEALG